jgi:ubiquinone/menaquinone biosynthesis C-methylase UbiE
MDNPTNQELFQYYNERASEYEEFYYGRFPTPRLEPDIYLKDREPIESLVGNYISGKCVDIACGTSYWLPFYYKDCTGITLIDQSENMLEESRKKIERLGIHRKTTVIQSDVFNRSIADGSFDCALIGFLISHFDDSQLAAFMEKLKTFLKPGGSFVIIDSNWGDMNQSMRLVKAGIDERQLFDGRKYNIYKRFFAKSDLQHLCATYGIKLEIPYWGGVFFMAAGSFV